MPPRRRAYRSGNPQSHPTKRVAAPEEVPLSEMFGFVASAINKQVAEPNLLAYQPHPKQRLFHEATTVGRLYLGGNRSGKTTAGIAEDLWWVTRRHPYRQIPSDVEIRGRVLGDGFDNGTVNQVLIPAIKRWVVPSDLINGSWEDSFHNASHTLTLENGSFIEFKSYDQDLDKHAGTSRHFIHFDEEPPQDIFKESLIRLIDTQGLWWITLTPINGMTWVYDELFQPWTEDKLKTVSVVQVSMTDNPYLNNEYITDQMELHAGDEETRIQGKFQPKGGLVFPEFSFIHQVALPNWQPPLNWQIFMSMDHGVNNPTAVLWHAVSPENFVITFAEHYERNMIVKDHANKIKEMEGRYQITNRIYARPGDPAMKQRNGVTGTSIVQAYADEGIYLNVNSIPRDVMTGIDRMRTYLRLSSDDTQQNKPHWTIIADNCPNLVRELKRLHWATYSSSKMNSANNVREQVHKKDDHAFDSTRYFFTMMPELGPDALWHAERMEFAPASYIDTLIKMSEIEQSGRTVWHPGKTGFSDPEYDFANLENGNGFSSEYADSSVGF